MNSCFTIQIYHHVRIEDISQIFHQLCFDNILVKVNQCSESSPSWEHSEQYSRLLVQYKVFYEAIIISVSQCSSFCFSLV